MPVPELADAVARHHVRKARSHPKPPLTPPRASDDQSTHLHRQAIGYLGFLLPFLVYLMAAWRPAVAAERWTLLRSISSYYYSSGVVAFAGILSGLSIFLLTYAGYRNKHQLLDRITGVVAGVAAAMVALFPTSPPTRPGPPWWREYTVAIHISATALLFVCFIFFSLYLFTRPNPAQPKPGPDPRKAVYVACGVGMAVSILWAALVGGHRPIFWQEAAALWFFGISWLAKGRAEWTLGALGRRSIHYTSHPGEITADLTAAARRFSQH